MEYKILSVDKLIASDQISDEDKLAEYHTLISKGEKISPCIVGHSDLVKNHKDYGRIPKAYTEKLEELNKLGAEHLIFDGNHRASAYALNHKDVPCIEIYNESDLFKLELMAKKEEINPFIHIRSYYEKEFARFGGYKPSTIAYRLVDFDYIQGTISKMLEKFIISNSND